jgi:hypothetical protein
MRKAFVWLASAAVAAGLVGPVFAQGASSPGSPAAPAQPAAPATGGATAPTLKPAAKKASVKSVTGTVKTVAPDSLVLVTASKDKSEKEWVFLLDRTTKIRKGGKAAGAKDLAEKDAATVSYKEADGKLHATSVTVRAAKKKA